MNSNIILSQLLLNKLQNQQKIYYANYNSNLLLNFLLKKNENHLIELLKNNSQKIPINIFQKSLYPQNTQFNFCTQNLNSSNDFDETSESEDEYSKLGCSESDEEESSENSFSEKINNTNSEKLSNGKKKSGDTMDFKTKWKTEKCHYWEMYGECKFGENCAFAHGDNELKQKTNNTNYKTKPCKQFFEEGYCNYGIRCQFSHKKSVYESYHNIKPKNKKNLNENICYTNIIPELLTKGYVNINSVKRPRLSAFKEIVDCDNKEVMKNRLLFYQDVLDIMFLLKRTKY